MDIFVYADESGVFDKFHSDDFVFAGLVFLSKESADTCERKYKMAESVIRVTENITSNKEIKASNVSNRAKGKLFRSLNNEEKFGIVIDMRELIDDIFSSKKNKQRYLNNAFNFAIRAKFEDLINEKKIVPEKVERISFYIDDHSTNKDMKYEFKESLEETLQLGTINKETVYYRKPLFPRVRTIQVEYCDSKSNTLIRCADIVSNKLFHMTSNNDFSALQDRKFDVVFRP